MLGVASVLISLIGPNLPAPKVRNVDADVLRVVVAPYAGRNSKPGRREVILLDDQYHTHQRPSFSKALDDTADALENGTVVPVTEEKASRRRLAKVRSLTASASGNFVPPAVTPLAALDLNSNVLIGSLRHFGRVYASLPLSGTKNVFPVAHGSISLPTYSPDGRYAAVCLVLVPYHLDINYFVLRHDSKGWMTICHAEMMPL